MDIVPVASVVCIAEVTEDRLLESKIKSLEASKVLTEKIISTTMKRIQRAQSEIDSTTVEIRASIKVLLDEIRELNALRFQRQQEHRRPEDDLDREFKQFSQEEFEDVEGDISSALSNNPDADEINTLFKRIAFKTHPDRTDNTSLHGLFVLAKELRDKEDLEGLKSLWDVVTGKAEKLESKLQRRLLELTTELSRLRESLAYLKSSNDYKIAEFFEQDKYTVLSAAHAQMVRHQQQLYSHIVVLRQIVKGTV